MTDAFDSSDHGLLRAGIAPAFDRLTTGTHTGRWFCVVDMSADGTSTFGAACVTQKGDAPANGDPILTSGVFGQFTQLQITGVVYAYRAE